MGTRRPGVRRTSVAWVPLAALLATLCSGCFAVDNFGRAPIVQNLTDDTIWTYFTASDLPGLNNVYAIGPHGQASVVTNTASGCVPMEWFYVVAEDPERSPTHRCSSSGT